MGVITFSSEPTGVHVELDGKLQSQVTPFTLELPAGREYKVSFQLDGFESDEQSFLVPMQPYEVKTKLRPASKVHVESTPPGAMVDVDGKTLLAATPGEVPLVAGDHVLVLRLNGYAPVQVKVKSGIVTPLQVKLGKEAFIKVDSVPLGASILLDNNPMGETPADRVSITAGQKHTLLLKYKKLSSDLIQIKPLKVGETRSYEVQLHDQNFEALQRDARRVKDELAYWQKQQAKYQRATEAFMISDAHKAQRNAKKLQEADDHIDALSNELDELTQQIEDVKP